MRVAILGATGRVGQVVLHAALADGHQVTLLARNAKKAEEIRMWTADLTSHGTGKVRITEGDAREASAVYAALADAEVVFSALGTDGGTVLSESTPHIIAGMMETGATRLVTIGTAGILNSRAEPGLLRYESVESRRTQTRAAVEHRRVWEQLVSSSLNWTIVCPTYLPDGERQGGYRVEREYLPEGGRSISVTDTAEFAYLQLWNKSYTRTRVGISY